MLVSMTRHYAFQWKHSMALCPSGLEQPVSCVHCATDTIHLFESYQLCLLGYTFSERLPTRDSLRFSVPTPYACIYCLHISSVLRMFCSLLCRLFRYRSVNSAAKQVKGGPSSNATRPGAVQPLPARPGPLRPAAATTRAPPSAKQQQRPAPRVPIYL